MDYIYNNSNSFQNRFIGHFAILSVKIILFIENCCMFLPP